MSRFLKYLVIALLTFVIAAAFSRPLFADTLSKRRISLYNINTKDKINVIYRRNGKYQAEAMKRINWVLRDWRANRSIRIDPKLIDLVWEIYQELGSRKPIHVISAFRSQKTNTMLRRTRGGQARRSQHMLGKAIDIRFPDVPVHRLRYAGLIRERGGVGYYPTSGTPFVHIDTGRVRHWPQIGRYELALLFAKRKTKHYPNNIAIITPRDVKFARQHYPKLAQRIAAYHNLRRFDRKNESIAFAPSNVARSFQNKDAQQQLDHPQLAARPRPAQPMGPKLLAPPKLVYRPSQFVLGSLRADKQVSTRLAQFAITYKHFGRASGNASKKLSADVEQVASPPRALPRALPNSKAIQQSGQTSFVAESRYDEEHPEETCASHMAFRFSCKNR